MIADQLHNIIHSTWPPRLAALVISGLIGWWGYLNILPMFEQETDGASTPIIVNVPETKRADFKNMHLFGEAKKGTAVNTTTEAKETKLNLALRGILATADPQTGMAQIQNAGKDEKYFLVEDEIFGLATLKEIYIDRVIIQRGDRFETLMLPEEFLNTKHFEAAKLRQERKRVATEYRDIFLTRNGMELIKLFGFETRFRNGAFQGFIVRALGDKGREMMETLGVMEGDLIVEVNGLRFAESLEATAQLKDLKDATSVDVIIDRNGTEMPFHFEFDKRIEEIVEVPEGMTLEEYEDEQVLAEPDFGESPEDLEFIEKQKARKTGENTAVEFDH